MSSAKIFNRLHFLLASTLLLLLSCSGQGASLLFSFATSTPENLRITATDLDISLSWDAVEEAESYSVYRYTNAGCSYVPDNYSQCDQATRWSRISVTSIEDTNLNNDTSYHYRVIAHGSGSDSELSEEVSARIEPATIPAPARNVEISLEPGIVYLQWTGDSNADYYVVYRVTDTQGQNCVIPESFTSCGDFTEAIQSSQLDASETYWTNDSITDGESYFYIVVSYSDYGSSNSESMFVTTIPGSPVINSTSSSNAGLQLQWDARLGASYYELYRYSTSGCLNDSNIGTFANCGDALVKDDLSSTETEYLDDVSDVASNHVYYRLRAGNSNGSSYLSQEYHYNLDLDPPDEFNLTTNGSTHILYWSEVLRATGYSLYRYTDSSCSISPADCSDVAVFNLADGVLSYTDASAMPGVFYYYSLRARDGSGWSAYTGEVNTSTAPLAVSNLQASAGDQQIELSWDSNNNSGDTKYTIYRFDCSPELPGCGTGTIAGTINVAARSDGASSFIDSGLGNAQQYYYLVSSSVEGWELNSSLANATTDPKPLTNSTASVLGNYSIRLSWSNSNDNQDDASYSVYLYSCLPSSTGCVPERTEALGMGEILTHDIEGLIPGSRYYFRAGVTANEVEHNTSTVDAYTLPLAPESISYESEVDEITISWQSSNGDDTTYEVESSACAGCTWDTNIHIPSSEQSFVYQNLTPGEAYEIRVRADSGGREAYSEEQEAFTKPVAPDPDLEQFELVAGNNAITINWDGSINGSNTTYTVVRYPCDLLSNESCNSTIVATLSGNGYLTYTDGGLISSNLYSYLIRATNGHLSAESSALSEITAPFGPSNVEAIGADRSVTVSWTEQGSEVTAYDLYQSQYDCSQDQLLDNNISACGAINLSTNVPSGIELSNLQPATKYYYNIKAYNPGNGLYNFSGSSESAITYPEAPETLEWQSQSSGITLSWSTDDNGAEATWRLYRYSCDPYAENDPCSEYDYVENFEYEDTSFVDLADNTSPGYLYYYVISAVAGYFELKSQDALAALAAPIALSDLIASSGVTDNSSKATNAEMAGLYVDLNWTSNGNDVNTNYTIYRKGCGEDEPCEDIYQFGSHTGEDSYGVRNSYGDKDVGDIARDLDPATLYTYIVNMSVSVVSLGSDDTVEANSSVEVITRPVAVTDLQVADANISSDSAVLQWQDNGGDGDEINSYAGNGNEVSYEVDAYLCAAEEPDIVDDDCDFLATHESIETTDHNVTGLAPGSYHALLVRSLSDGASIDSAPLIDVITKPEAASIVTAEVSASDTGGTELKTTWNSANGSATSYNRYLYEYLRQSSFSLKTESDIQDNSQFIIENPGLYSWVDSYTAFNSSYVYEVVIAAETETGEINSSSVRFAPLPKEAEDLAVVVLDSTTVKLSWSNTGAHTGHEIYAFTNACDIDKLAEDIADSFSNDCNIVGTNSTANASSEPLYSFINLEDYSSDFAGLTPGTQYYFAIKTINDSGETWSASQLKAITHPSAVTELSGSATSSTIDISWSANDDGAETSYRVYIFEPDCSVACDLLSEDYPALVGTNTSYSATNLDPGSSHSITIASIADGVEVNASAIEVITVPVVPDSITATLNSSDPASSIDIIWNATSINNGAATSYQLLRFSCLDGDCTENDANLTIDSLAFDAQLYTDINLTSGSGYRYVLQAYTSADEVNSSITDVINTNSAAVDSLTISEIAQDGFKVSFTAPDDNGPDTSYRIYLGECTSNDQAGCSGYDFDVLDQGQTEFEFEDLQSAQYYGVFVAALIDGYEANSTTEVVATLPSAFTSLSASVINQNISLDYSSANGSAAVYRAYLYQYTSLEDKSSASRYDIGSAGSSYTIANLNAGTKYDIALAVSNGDWATEINSTLVSSTTYPLAVTNLLAIAGDQSISLSWNNDANGAATSHVVYSFECDPSSTGCSSLPVNAADSTTDYESTNLASGEDYYYVIGAQAGGIEANSTGIDASTLPTGLTDLSTIGIADSFGVEISYKSDNGSSATYVAYRYDCGYDTSFCTTQGLADATITLTASGGTDSDASLKPASYYRYSIGVSSGGEELKVDVSPDALTAPEAPALDANKISSSDSTINISSYDEPDGVINSHYLVLTENECDGESIKAVNTSSCGQIYNSKENQSIDIEFADLMVNSEYFLSLFVENDTGTAFSDAISVTTLPEIPSLDIVGINLGLQVLFTSTDSENTSYTFWVSDSSCSNAAAIADGGNCDFNHSIDNLSPGSAFDVTDSDTATSYFAEGTEYFGAIEATNSAGSSYSEVVSATTVPLAPASIVATGGTKQISFSWSSVQGAYGYHLRAYLKSCDASNMDATDMTIGLTETLVGGDVVTNCSTTYVKNVDDLTSASDISSLAAGKTYFYRLGSSNANSNANWSVEGAMDTLPTVPSNLQSGEITSFTIDISWFYNTREKIVRQDLYRYTIETCTEEQLLNLSAGLGGNSGEVSDDDDCGDFSYTQGVGQGATTVTGLDAGTTYYFRVAFVNDAGLIMSSEVLTATTDADSSSSQSSAVELNEPLQSEQWYLTNTGQKAYAGYSGIANVDINHSGALELGFTGANIRVNVIDTGMEMQHPDLLANIVADGSYDYVDDDNDPSNYSTTGGDHGTSVAGLIAADDNGAGITGVAPDALLQAFNYLRSSQTTSDYLLAHGGDTKLDDTAIFNKSLGVAVSYDYRVNSTRLEALSCFTSGGATDHESPENCSEALRSGLGAIYVKAAGNDFSATATDELCLSFGLSCRDANMDAEHAYPYQVVVGALNASGTKSSYSNAGSALWLTAPAGEYGWDYDFMESELNKYGHTLPYDASNPIWYPAMLTTDQVGCERGNTTYRYDFETSGVPPIGVTQFHEDDTLNPDCDYASTFNGTSAATPVVSGVIALMLEANANLSWRDVKHILAASSDVIDASIAEVSIPVLLCSTDCSDGQYTASDSLEFVARDSWQTNAAGYDFHNWYGFGAANAGAAVAMAESYASQLGQWQKLSVSQNFNQDIPDATGSALQVSINQPDDITVEAVQLDLQIAHSYLGNLSVVLVSPSGTRSVLLTPFGLYDDDVDFDANLLSNAFYGEAGAGDWQLQIYDLMQADTGSLVSVTLNVYGH